VPATVLIDQMTQKLFISLQALIVNHVVRVDDHIDQPVISGYPSALEQPMVD